MMCVFAAPYPVAGDEGAKIFAEACTTCHPPLGNVHFTEAQWKNIIERMIDKGADISRNQIPELLKYLVQTRGSKKDAANEGNK
jgi:mono/diheme cytochrome c family protein